MPVTFTKIASVTVGAGGASTINFSSIPSSYTDLVLFTSTRNDAAWVAGEQQIQFNNSTANFSARALYGTGNAGAGSYSTTVTIPAYTDGDTATANTFSSAIYYIPNYTSSNYKSVSTESLFETNAAQASQYMVAGLWSNNAAITSITLTTTNNSSGAAANWKHQHHAHQGN